MNYIMVEKDGFMKGSWMSKGSKYTLNSEDYLHSFNDLPALIHPDGSQSWYLNGKLHRSDGPAIIYSDGSQDWYLNGKLVRPIEVFSLLKAKGLDLTHFTLDKDKKVREAVKKIIKGYNT